jgi:hypothetical protein
MKREKGYYWIKLKEFDEWVIAEYDCSWGIYGWWVCGADHVFYDKDIEEIGEKIERKTKGVES